ncbi:MAG: PP2C family protein-serine/threonine phosphatase, partial [Acidimicrobiales bacterium]
GRDRANPDRDERDLGWVAAVTDRGLRHRSNEDAMAVTTIGRAVIGVVCDGVSTTPGSAFAARAAADAALGTLRRAVGSGGDLTDAMTRAVAAAQGAAGAVAAADPENPPACTFVAAIGDATHVVVGWLGDSRAYWLDGRSGERLTLDDSWAAELVAAGLMTEGDAEADARAHRITRWLGADAPSGDVNVVVFKPPGPGWLVVCSDGLWNYGSTPDVLAPLLTGPQGGHDTPLHAARRLCEFALSSGGHDNITVIVARMEGREDDDVPV